MWKFGAVVNVVLTCRKPAPANASPVHRLNPTIGTGRCVVGWAAALLADRASATTAMTSTPMRRVRHSKKNLGKKVHIIFSQSAFTRFISSIDAMTRSASLGSQVSACAPPRRFICPSATAPRLRERLDATIGENPGFLIRGIPDFSLRLEYDAL